MLDRATREWSTSPQIATLSPRCAPCSADRERIKQRLRGVFMGAVTRVHDGTVDLARKKVRGAGLGVTDDNDIRAHCVQRHGRVDKRLALFFRRLSDRHVHDVGAKLLPAISNEAWVRVEDS